MFKVGDTVIRSPNYQHLPFWVGACKIVDKSVDGAYIIASVSGISISLHGFNVGFDISFFQLVNNDMSLEDFL
jgi:hypothetical protein